MLGETVMEVFSGITRLAEPFKGILLDAYGVFWGGNACGVLPGAQDAMEKLMIMGKQVGILSNSTQLAGKELKKLESHGLMQGKHFHFLMTSGEIGRQMFLSETLPFDAPRKTFWLFGSVHPKFASHESIFQGSTYTQTLDIAEADFIYLSVPHLHGEDQTDPELFRTALEKVSESKLPIVCLNPDRYAHEGNPPRAVVRQGSIAKMYEEMGGQVFYIGKPALKAYMAAILEFEKTMQLAPEEILMVGDTPETDIQGARLMGMSSALILQTGIMADRIAREGSKQALGLLPLNCTPNFFVERLIDDL